MTLGTLVFVGVLKEGLADMKRWRVDRKSNSEPVKLLTGALVPPEKYDNSTKR
jgi:hypothetical protein